MFPQYKHSDSVAIVGWARTSRHLAPFNIPGIDLWGLNEATKFEWWKGGETMWFQIHPKWDFMRKNNRNDPHHWDWLQQSRDIPIFMQDKYKDIPMSVRFPLEDLIDRVGMYLTSSFSYMMGLAILMEYKRIELYGFEMSHDSEFQYQKPAAEYLIGYAKGQGIEVVLPEKCSLLRANLYAYEDLRAADRSFLALMHDSTEHAWKEKESLGQQQLGRVDMLQTLMMDQTLSPELRKEIAQRVSGERDRLMVAIADANHAKGALDNTVQYEQWHDSQNTPADRVREEPKMGVDDVQTQP